MTDDDSELSLEETFQRLEDQHGQTYLTAERAATLLEPFAPYVTDGYVENAGFDVKDEHTPLLALEHALADAQQPAKDARGITTVAPHVPILTYADLTALLAEALGEAESRATMVGHGSTADARHDENLDAIENALWN